MIRIRNCEAGYGKLRILKGVSLHVAPGEIVAIIGPNGAGKTTLLHTIAGLVPARSGELLLGGRSIRNLPPERVVELGCSLVPEGRQVFSTMTVYENLILGSYLQLRRGRERGAGSGRLDFVFGLFPVLAERRGQLAGTLSGGEQQMLAIGRALMSGPRLLMMDEPSMGIAPLVVRTIFRTVRRLREEGVTILLVEQNARASMAVADRGYVLETGQIVLDGTAAELMDNTDVQRAYLGKEYRRIDE
jgi:branched-chain amino acid transport system ATP-binding protein